MNTYCSQNLILILASIHHVLKAEKILKKTSVAFDLVPVPKEVNPDCGLAVEIATEDLKEVIDALRQAEIKISHIYQRSGRSFQPVSGQETG
ncbi:MAG: DUF3343 domain-containing protein [Deltaproteobacteria bacterium]|nr:DUF3343 domain-containing protein [Deltaproteobacteria bacterium]